MNYLTDNAFPEDSHDTEAIGPADASDFDDALELTAPQTEEQLTPQVIGIDDMSQSRLQNFVVEETLPTAAAEDDEESQPTSSAEAQGNSLLLDTPQASSSPNSAPTAVDNPNRSPSPPPEAEAPGDRERSKPTDRPQIGSPGYQVKPRTWYNKFLASIKQPSCKGIINALSEFVETFPKVVKSRSEVTGPVHKFLAQVEQALLETECYADASEKERHEAREGLEKFVTSKVYSTVFGCEDRDAREDAVIDQCIRRLGWLRFDHLDIPAMPEADTLDLAAQELKKLNRTKAPGEKLVLIINCFRVIISILEHTGKSSKSETKPSADDILPLLIIVLVKANPPNLYSNLEYIASMRHPSRFVGEDLYAYTQLLSAVSFVKQCRDASKLNIGQEEFEKLTREAVSSDEEIDTETGEKRGLRTDDLQSSEKRWVSKGRLDELINNLDDVSLSFDGLQNVAHLRIADIEDLFSEYQRLSSALRNTRSALKHIQQGTG